jgi:hypothetical protein
LEVEARRARLTLELTAEFIGGLRNAARDQAHVADAGLPALIGRTFQITDEAGRVLRPHRVSVHSRDAQERIAVEYPFGGRRPAVLRISPALNTPASRDKALSLIVFHEAVPVIDYQYWQAPESLILDWQDPWRSRFENPAFKRHHETPNMAFLYVESNEVRYELLLRLSDMRRWLNWKPTPDIVSDRGQMSGMREAIAAFIQDRSQLLIDGQPGRAIIDRVDLLRMAAGGPVPVADGERISMQSILIGVVLAFNTTRLPERIQARWTLFDEQVDRVTTVAYDPVGQDTSYVTPDQPLFEWTNALDEYPGARDRWSVLSEGVAVTETDATVAISLPALAGVALLLALTWQLRFRQRQRLSNLVVGGACAVFLGVAIAAPKRLSISLPNPLAPQVAMSNEAAALLAQSLLKNVYRAFDFRAEVDVYDKLALSVARDLLEEIYLQNRRAWSVHKAGGAQGKVQDVRVSEARARPLPERRRAVELHTCWRAAGTVSHWGHSHTRHNEYEALITVEPDQGVWKITALRVLDERIAES